MPEKFSIRGYAKYFGYSQSFLWFVTNGKAVLNLCNPRHHYIALTFLRLNNSRKKNKLKTFKQS